MGAVLQNFEKLKNKSKKLVEEKHPEKNIIIQIGSATCEMAAGSNAVYEKLEKNIKTSGRKDIILKHVGCTGRCSLEPIITIFKPGEHLYVYKSVDANLAEDIFKSHIIEDKPIEKHLLIEECKRLEREKNKSQKQL